MNPFLIMVAFFIAYMEAGISELNVYEFDYVYGIKVYAKHEGFCYIAKRGVDVEGIVGLRDNMGWWKDNYLFSP